MAPSLCPPLIQDTPCPYCFGIYTLGGLSRHVKSAHPLVSLVPYVSKVIFSLQAFSFPMFFLGSIFLAFWGWL